MDLNPDARSPAIGQVPLLVPQSSPNALPSATLEKSLFVDSRLSVDDAIVGTGKHNRPGIAPPGVSMTDAIVPFRVSRVIPSSLD